MRPAKGCAALSSGDNYDTIFALLRDARQTAVSINAGDFLIYMIEMAMQDCDERMKKAREAGDCRRLAS